MVKPACLDILGPIIHENTASFVYGETQKIFDLWGLTNNCWLVSDLGKILLLPQFGELPQWAVVGENYSLNYISIFFFRFVLLVSFGMQL